MRLIGSFQTITIHGRSGIDSSSVDGSWTSAGAADTPYEATSMWLTACSATPRTAPAPASRPPEQDPRHEMIAALLQDHVRARAGRLDVLEQVRAVRALPDALRGCDRVRVGQLRIAMEV